MMEKLTQLRKNIKINKLMSDGVHEHGTGSG